MGITLENPTHPTVLGLGLRLGFGIRVVHRYSKVIPKNAQVTIVVLCLHQVANHLSPQLAMDYGLHNMKWSIANN